MIWAAILIEAIIGDWANFWVLLFLQCLNGSVGFYGQPKIQNPKPRALSP